MAKQKAQEPTLAEDSSTTTPEITPEQEATSSKRPDQTQEEPVPDETKVQMQRFLDDFEKDDEDIAIEREGEVVRTAEAKAPAQSEATSETPEVDAEGKPVVAPAVETVTPEVKAEEGKPAQQPEKKTATEVQEETAAVQTPEQIQARYVEWRQRSEELLAKQHYKFDKAQLDEMDLNPGEFISKCMARVYLDTITATMQQFTQHLPGMVQQINQQANRSSSDEEQFYSRWPKLKEHSDTVLRVGAVYRQLNPSASVEDFINEVGAQTMVAMRIPLEEVRAQVQQKPNGAIQTPPFRPAASSPAGGPPQQQQRNVFDLLTDEFEEVLDT